MNHSKFRPFQKLLSLMLMLGLVMCLFGCDGMLFFELEEHHQLDAAPLLRDELVEYRCEDFCFYIGRDFELVKDLGKFAKYATDDLTVVVSCCKVSGDPYPIADTKEFAEFYIRSEKPRWSTGEYTYEMEQAYGTWYVHSEIQWEGKDPETNVTGFYIDGDYGWFISVEGSNCQDLLPQMIHYATLGQFCPETSSQPDATAE